MEVQRQLGCDYVVELINMGKQLWSTASDIKYLTYKIEIFDNEGWHVFFLVCENEFDRSKQQSEDLNEFDRHRLQLKNLTALARVRFFDAVWDIRYAKEQANV